MENTEEIELNALQISDLVDDSDNKDESLSQIMAASCTTSGCACSSSSSS